MSNTIKKNDYFKIKIFVGQHHGGTWTHTALLPLAPLKKKDWCACGPSPSLYFYLGPGGIGSRWGTWSPLSLSLSALGWSFLRSALTLSMPATLYPLSPTETKWRAGIWIKQWNTASVHLSECDPDNDMEIQSVVIILYHANNIITANPPHKSTSLYNGNNSIHGK